MTIFGTKRIALLTRLVEKAPGGTVGRTAVMKFLYFLTALRHVQLGYRFSLYSYGPFDSAVLEDIDYAARLKALDISVEYNPVGYGYVIRPAASAQIVKDLDADFVNANEPHLDWVLQEFGGLTATELELASTIVYVYLDEPAASQRQIADRVHQIKPHFAVERITAKFDDLKNRGIIP